jgi:hypothetical protein
MTMYILLKSKVGSYTYLVLERQFCNVQFQKCREIIITSTVYMLLKSRLRLHFHTKLRRHGHERVKYVANCSAEPLLNINVVNISTMQRRAAEEASTKQSCKQSVMQSKIYNLYYKYCGLPRRIALTLAART